MSDMSPGERILLRFRWFVYDAGSRPVAAVAVLVILGVIAWMAASFTSASSTPLGSFRLWILYVVGGFGPDVQLGVLVATLLLIIDALTGAEFAGQRVLFAVIVVLAAVGIAANVTAIVAWLSFGVGSVGTTAEAWAQIIARYLSPTVLAAVAGWAALSAIRSAEHRGSEPT